MITFIENKIIKENKFGDLEDLNFIKESFEKLKVHKKLGIITSHSICRAFGKFLDIKVESGYYLNKYEHSWLISQFGNIIDVYPYNVVGGPILVYRNMRLNYIKSHIPYNIINKIQIDFLFNQLKTYI
jgi:hypothetical protein